MKKMMLENKIYLLEEELECIHLYLDKLGAERVGEKGDFSICGRILNILTQIQNDR